MKKAYVVSLAMGLAVILVSGSLFAAGVALTGVGARPTALSGCYRGIADDWSAMYWNPAGLTQISGMHFGGSFEVIMPKAKYTPAMWNGMPFSAMGTAEVENEAQAFFIPSVGLSYGFEGIAFGLAVYAPFGLGSKWDLLDTPKYNASYPSADFEDDLKTFDVHPTFAYQLSDKLSIGLGVSIVYADIMIRKPTFTPNPYFKPEFETFRASALVPNGGMNPEFNHLLTDTELEGGGLGFGGNIGLMFKATDDLKVGLSARYYADVSLDGTLNADTYFATNPACHQAIEGALKPTLDQMLQGGLLSQEEYGVLLYYYSGGTRPKYDNVDAEATLPLPMNVGIGLAYSGIDNVVASFDVDWTQWSSWDVIEIEMPDDAKTELVEKWEDTIRIGMGLEYSLGMLTLRASCYTEPTAVPDETMTVAIPDVGRRNVVNLGLGYRLGHATLHGSYEHFFVGDRDIPISGWVPTEDRRGYDNMAGSYKMAANLFIVGMEYSF